MRLTENTGYKNWPKIRHLGTITTLLCCIFAIKARIDNREKKLVLAIWWTSAHWRLGSVYQFGAPQHISTGFAYWQRYCMAL